MIACDECDTWYHWYIHFHRLCRYQFVITSDVPWYGQSTCRGACIVLITTLDMKSCGRFYHAHANKVLGLSRPCTKPSMCVYIMCDYSPRTCVGVEEAPEQWVCSGCSHLKRSKYELLTSEDN